MADAAKDGFVVTAPKGPLSDVQGQIHGDNLPGYGACDPLFRDSPSALLVFSYSTVVIKLTRDPATGNLVSAPNTQVQAFSYGVGEDPAPAGFPAGGPTATEDLTDAFNGGAPVERGQMAVVTAMVCNMGKPFGLAGEPAPTPSAPGLRTYTAWMDEYDARARESVMLDVLIEFTYGNTACKYRMGVPQDWGTMSANTMSANSHSLNGLNGVALPFRAATVINARDESRKLTINIRTGSLGISIPQSPGIPATTTDLFVPIRIQLLRYPICAVDAGACAVGGMSDSDIARLARAMKAMG
jgi:hypothetical protein